MKKHFTEEQIIGFLREAEAGLPISPSRLSAIRARSTDSSQVPIPPPRIFMRH